ncbi:MAG: IS1096 element passenger TnpR family protein [Bacteroidia bacterium]
MAIYRFRVILEENDDVYRDIEIRSGQTFEDLHNAIQEAFRFDKKHAASFFVSDDYWRKGQEITLREEDLPQDAEDIRKNIPAKKLMSAIKTAKYIDDPHQRFVYVFDPVVQWSFTLELMKIGNEDPKAKYPLCVKTAGIAPKQYKQPEIIKDEAPGDLMLAALLKDAKPAEDHTEEPEIYKSLAHDEVHGIEEEDLTALEGEEGEEDEAVEEEQEFGDDEGEGHGSFGFEEDEH